MPNRMTKRAENVVDDKLTYAVVALDQRYRTVMFSPVPSPAGMQGVLWFLLMSYIHFTYAYDISAS